MPPPPRRGAALLVAMVMLTVVAALSAGMIWQQFRAVQVEIAERGRVQAAWILAGALDWARLIIREHRSTYSSLHDAWAQPLAEARLSTFLAADRDNTVDTGLDAFLSGEIADAQARYNLTNVVNPDGKVNELEKKVLERLCQAAGLPDALAAQIVQQLAAAMIGTEVAAPLMPSRIDDLAWLGLDPTAVATLRPWLTLLPQRTKVNVNTAPREVIAAVVEGLDAGSADRLVQQRQRQPFKALEEVKPLLPEQARQAAGDRLDVKSDFFEVRGRLRLEDRVLEEQSLVHRRSPGEVVVVRGERRAGVLGGG